MAHELIEKEVSQMKRLRNLRFKSRCKARCQKGVTMLEVMISILILTIGILGLAPLIGIAVHNNSFANDLTVANALAQKEIESLVAQQSYGALPMIQTSDSVSGVYQVNRRVDDNSVLASVPIGVYKLSVNIKWTDQKQKQRSIDYSIFKPKS